MVDGCAVFEKEADETTINKTGPDRENAIRRNQDDKERKPERDARGLMRQDVVVEEEEEEEEDRRSAADQSLVLSIRWDWIGWDGMWDTIGWEGAK